MGALCSMFLWLTFILYHCLLYPVNSYRVLSRKILFSVYFRERKIFLYCTTLEDSQNDAHGDWKAHFFSIPLIGHMCVDAV